MFNYNSNLTHCTTFMTLPAKIIHKYVILLDTSANSWLNRLSNLAHATTVEYALIFFSFFLFIKSNKILDLGGRKRQVNPYIVQTKLRPRYGTTQYYSKNSKFNVSTCIVSVFICTVNWCMYVTQLG